MPYVGTRFYGGGPAALSLWHFNDDLANTSDAFTWGSTGLSVSATSKWGGGSMQIDAGATITSAYDPGPYIALDWTMEGWTRIGDFSNLLFSITKTGGSVTFRYQSVGGVQITLGSSKLGTSAVALTGGSASTDVFYHWAVVHTDSDDSYRAYFNGALWITLTGTDEDAGVYSLKLDGGAQANFLDDLRFVNFARYTGATYTIPTAEFPS